MFESSFWEYSILKKLFLPLGQWKDHMDVPFQPEADHPCLFSFGQSLVWKQDKPRVGSGVNNNQETQSMFIKDKSYNIFLLC